MGAFIFTAYLVILPFVVLPLAILSLRAISWRHFGYGIGAPKDESAARRIAWGVWGGVMGLIVCILIETAVDYEYRFRHTGNGLAAAIDHALPLLYLGLLPGAFLFLWTGLPLLMLLRRLGVLTPVSALSAAILWAFVASISFDLIQTRSTCPGQEMECWRATYWRFLWPSLIVGGFHWLFRHGTVWRVLRGS